MESRFPMKINKTLFKTNRLNLQHNGVGRRCVRVYKVKKTTKVLSQTARLLIAEFYCFHKVISTLLRRRNALVGLSALAL